MLFLFAGYLIYQSGFEVSYQIGPDKVWQKSVQCWKVVVHLKLCQIGEGLFRR